MSDSSTPARVVFLTDEAGTVTTWNAACETLFGLPQEGILGRSVTVLFTPSGRDAWTAGWPALALQSEGATLQLDLHCARGRSFTATLTLAPQIDASGALLGCAVALTTDWERDEPEAERVLRMPLSTIVDMLPGTFYVINRAGRFLAWNHNLERVTELTPDELGATRAVDLFDLAQRPAVAEALRRVFDDGEEVTLEVEFASKSGRETPFVVCGTRVHCATGDYLFGLGIDISDRREYERKLRLRERALHAASNGIVITRLDGRDNRIEYVNPAFERITGYLAADIIGQDPRFMAVPGMDGDERRELHDAVAARRPANVVLRNLHKSGALFWNDLRITPVQDDGGAVTHYIGVVNDVTSARQRTAHLEHEVNHDPLTGLANRNLLWDRLEQALHLAQRQKTLVATVLLDLNDFKTINDTHGHEAGDVVLKVVARRLLASVRDSDTVARMSGDEFVLVLANQPSLRYTLRMVERLRQSFAIPVGFNGREIRVGASLGVSLFPHDGHTATELVRAADVAMYHGKGNGHSNVHFFSPDMRSTTEARERIEVGLRQALNHDQLFLLYQPRVSVHSGKITGFEALLRWRHPEQGVLAPADFLAEAEESGIIVEIGERVLDQSCAFAAQLRVLGFPDVPVTVNVSQREYSQARFLPALADALARHQLGRGALLLDLRIEGLIRNPSLGRELAEQLHEMGVGLSVDGFGTGLCDLVFLQQLAAVHVKLAHSAVHGIGDGGAAVAKSLIDIGHNLDMEVVGDGVETGPQLDFLRANGCDQAQGSWFSAPLPGEAAQRMLQTNVHCSHEGA
jgi:diguanylate cyclase (GGDEF)-like protein/PAS domain S-box-containing protein